MAKKQAQFRFEEDFYSDINKIAEKEGLTTSEIVRNALKLYMAIYTRTKDQKAKLIVEFDDNENNKIELVLPWLL